LPGLRPGHSDSMRLREIFMSSDPMQKFGKEGMDMTMASFGAWTKNAQAIASELAGYSKKAFEDSAAAWERLLAAKSPDKAVEVQTEYLKSTYEEFVAQTTKISGLYADMAKEAFKPFENVLGKNGMK
jgi:phasin family protein